MNNLIPETVKDQLQKNAIALISLVIAISALAYNSWRNELSEENRNIRAAGFEIIKESAKLQFVIDRTTYLTAGSNNNYDAINGWATVNLILSLSELMPSSVNDTAQSLRQQWQTHWKDLETSEEANNEISKANRLMLQEVRNSLRNLH